jgi:hypothetical protein
VASVPSPLLESLSKSIAATFESAGLATTPDLSLLVSVIAARLAPNTWRTYSSCFGQFVRFCVSENLPFLPATEVVGLQWLLHVAKRGTVKADASRGYFAAVNTLHELLGWPKPCTGMMFHSFMRGWIRSQEVVAELEDSARVLACPATVALSWYRGLQGLTADSRWLKPLIYCVLSYRLFLRPATMLSIVHAEVVNLHGRWVLRYKPESWKTGVATVGSLPVHTFDITPFPLLRLALQAYLPGVGSGCMWGSSEGVSLAAAAGWFTAVLAEFTPDVMGQLTLYSCRRGGASAARAVGVPLDLIELMGGWAMGSVAMRRRYLDMSVVAGEAASFWFQGMLPGAAVPLFGAPYFR